MKQFGTLLYSATTRALNWTIAPKTRLVGLISSRQIIRKSTASVKKFSTTGIGTTELDDHNKIQHELSPPNYLDKESIKSAYCNEISHTDIGDFVQVRGLVVYINERKFLILKDKTAALRLVFKRDRKDLLKWLENLQKYSYIKVIGMVVEKEEDEKFGMKDGSREEFDLIVKHVFSCIPPSETAAEGDEFSEKEQEEGVTKLLRSSITSRDTITYKKISKKELGESVQIFGWINSMNNEKNTFVLSNVFGSIQVVPENAPDMLHEIQELKIDDMVVVEGVVTCNGDGVMADGKFPQQNKGNIHISSNFVRKLNDEHLFGIRAPDVNSYTVRSHNCGQLNANFVGKKVRLMGWVTYIRMEKFFLLQDKYGLVQLRLPEAKGEIGNLAKNLPLESVISVEGIVTLRPPENVNKLMKTGEIEIVMTDLVVINKAGTLPFYQKDERPKRPQQLAFRYLDLRQSMNARNNLEFRCQILHKMRRFLIENVGFVEVETPTLFGRTPGGAQEFIVPTRQKGEFFSLVQSPQQFKQLLMIGGLDRYFQIARCYRDEVSKKDRQPEFTQLDIEMSFCNRDGVMQLIEDIVKIVWPHNVSPITFPFPRMTYEEAINSYGTDKPDTRISWKINNVTGVFKEMGMACSERIMMERYMVSEDFTALGLVAKEGLSSYPKLKTLSEELATAEECKVFAFKLETRYKLREYLTKIFVKPIPETITNLFDYDAGDVVFLGFGRRKKLRKLFASLRNTAAKIVQETEGCVLDEKKFDFLWVVDFPLFEEVDGVIQSMHHPFTQPHPGDLKLLDTDPLKAKGLHYDLVLNGSEIGGGSIRIHNPALQEKVLCDILKLDKTYFEHLLKALSYGGPLHGGFALGIDRFLALLRGTVSIADVIAFPKYSTGRDPLCGAPSDIPQADKDLYHIK